MRKFTVSNGSMGGIPVLMATDETGADWYESQKNFQTDTLKIVFDADGVITSMSKDVSTLWPGGASVAEISPDSIPEGVSISGEWVFDGKQIKHRPILTAKRVRSKEEILADLEALREELLN